MKPQTKSEDAAMGRFKAEGKWGYTHCGDSYTGMYDTAEEAAEEGADEEGQVVTVGQYRAPQMAFVDAEMVVEHICEQDDYHGDWADNAIDASDEQMSELTDALRATISAWLDKHDLWPTFGIVEEIRQITVTKL